MAPAHVSRRKGIPIGFTVTSLLFFFFILDLALLSCARQSPSSRQKLQVHRHLKRLNKPPVKTIQDKEELDELA